MKHKLRIIILYGALLIIALVMGKFLFWLYSPPKNALSISPNPIPVLTKQVKPNDYVVLKLTRCKNVSSKGRIVISLVGSTYQLTLPPITDTSERSCDTDTKIPIPVPPQATPGTYHYHFRTTYQVNPITLITQDFDTENFTVL